MKVVMFPGQGSQHKGMGKSLFQKYKEETRLASDILGYDLEELCVEDPRRELGKTQFTQPALYVVNAFNYDERQETGSVDYLIGHSLGEYNALLAAGVFDFETGLRLVQKRGALMASASGGSMAAVLGLDAERVQYKLDEGGYTAIDIANFNTPTQIVISGPKQIMSDLIEDFDSQGIKIIQLFVTAPFHSRYMKPAATEYSVFLKKFEFSPLKIPVISNVTGLPYQENQIRDLLSAQIESSVRWTDTIRLLMGKGVTDYEEVGSDILTKMVTEIKLKCSPIFEEKETKNLENPTLSTEEKLVASIQGQLQNGVLKKEKLSMQLGSKAFRDTYGIKYAYATGAMYRGIASKELVVRMGKARMMGFLGTGGMSLEEIKANIKFIQKELPNGEAYGMNLLYNMLNPEQEMEIVKLYIANGVKNIEAAAFMQMTPSLVLFRLMGLRRDQTGQVISDHNIMAKVSRPEVAETFMNPAPERILNKLLEQRLITKEQIDMSKEVPMSHDICVEADSGGHTDRGVALVLLPAIQSMKPEIEKRFSYQKPIRIGLAGGIGTPESVACAFVMKADFVVTGSINQCTVEAGTSDSVKELLQEINVQDTDYAPAGDMFEIGAKIQVLKKGVLFSARANKLYDLYTRYAGLDEIPEKTIAQLEKSYFKNSLDTVWDSTKTYLRQKGDGAVIQELEENPKKKMAQVFKAYFGYSSGLAFKGNLNEKSNFQVHTGPALGAFNQWVKGTSLESWRNRHADEIGIKMMDEAFIILQNSLKSIGQIKFQKN